MGVNDILNEDSYSPLNPDFGPVGDLPDYEEIFRAPGGSAYVRQSAPTSGRIIPMIWNARLSRDVADKLRNFHQQHRYDFFSYYDIERGRYFSGRFEVAPSVTQVRFNCYTATAQFVEDLGLPMFKYPDNFDRDGVYLDDHDPHGNPIAHVTGTWEISEDADLFYGGACFSSRTPNDLAEWSYFGYGFEVVAATGPGCGILTVLLDDLEVGSADLYSAEEKAYSSIFAKTDIPLGLHRVGLKISGQNNVASSGLLCYADAIRVMR